MIDPHTCPNPRKFRFSVLKNAGGTSIRETRRYFSFFVYIVRIRLSILRFFVPARLIRKNGLFRFVKRGMVRMSVTRKRGDCLERPGQSEEEGRGDRVQSRGLPIDEDRPRDRAKTKRRPAGNRRSGRF